jgi:hypothetical protein
MVCAQLFEVKAITEIPVRLPMAMTVTVPMTAEKK